MREVLVATTNQGKVREIKEIFSQTGLRLISLAEAGSFPEVPETADTFMGNASQKAEAYFRLSGLPVIADDSGLVVDVLNGAPGVYSARYAGPAAGYAENNRRLVAELSPFTPPYTARFACVAAYCNGSLTITAEGTVEGVIVLEPRGTNGFGYDPHFLPAGCVQTMAELPADVKNAISHRGNAFRLLYNKLIENKLVYEEN